MSQRVLSSALFRRHRCAAHERRRWGKCKAVTTGERSGTIIPLTGGGWTVKPHILRLTTPPPLTKWWGTLSGGRGLLMPYHSREWVDAFGVAATIRPRQPSCPYLEGDHSVCASCPCRGSGLQRDAVLRERWAVVFCGGVTRVGENCLARAGGRWSRFPGPPPLLGSRDGALKKVVDGGK